MIIQQYNSILLKFRGLNYKKTLRKKQKSISRSIVACFMGRRQKTKKKVKEGVNTTKHSPAVQKKKELSEHRKTQSGEGER